MNSNCLNDETFNPSMRNAVILFALSAILSGCANEVPSNYSGEVMYAAGKEAVLDSVHLSTIAEACEELDDVSAERARMVKAAWFERNWRYVAASDIALNAHVRRLQQQQGEALGQLDLWNFIERMHHDEIKGLRRRVLKTDNRQQACLRRLLPFEEEGNDLVKDETYGDVYASLAWLYRAQAVTEPYPVPSFQPTISPTENLGRSLLTVEVMAEKNICSDYTVINLRDEWPKEVYGVLCNNVGKAVVECDWGSCKISEKF